MKKEFEVEGIVEIFPQDKGWHYIQLPISFTKMTTDLAVRGLVAITARIGNTTWKTSMLPKGDGTHFIPLSASLRKKENIILGKRVKIYFKFR